MHTTQPRTKEAVWRRALHRLWMMMTVLSMLTVTLMPVLPGMSVEADEAALPPPLRTARAVLYVQDAAIPALRDEDADAVDQINYAFALLEDGEATGRHWQGIRAMTAYLKRHPTIDGVLSVGGWGAEGFSDACATAEGRVKLADSILALMDAHGFVGVDIDWEYPGSSAGGLTSRPEDVENWYALLTLLRQGLDARQETTGRDYLLSVALGAGKEQVEAVDGARLGKLVDQAVVMGYDLRGFDRMTGHHAGLYPDGSKTLSAAWAVNAYADAGLPETKLLLGIPLYGRMWRRVTATDDGLHQRAETSGNKVVRYDEAQTMLAEGAVRHWDEEAQAAWLYHGSSFVSYEDEESLAAKAAWLRERKLLGAALWASDHDPASQLIKALSESLQ